MSVPLNFKVPTALEYFSALVADDPGFSLLEAAISIAQDEYPELDAQVVLSEVDALAARLKRRLPKDAGTLHILRALNRFFFQELGFAGNVNDFHDPDNSYLHRVLATRRGIPITLSLLYIELATQVGLTARGVAFPGHFLVKLRLPQGEVVIDPFNGQSLSREQLEERLDPYRRGRGLVGDFEVPLGLFLQAASSRDVVARMLHNLKEIHRDTRDLRRLLAVHDRLVLLLPDAWEEQRDRGLTLARMGQAQAAAVDLAVYLAHCPEADDAPEMRLKLAELQGSSRPLLH